MSASSDETNRNARGASAAGLGQRLAPLFLFVLACALYGLTRRTGTFSDAVQLVERVGDGPDPYYNALYLPLAWAFFRGLEPLLGWDAWGALAWLSVLAGALSVALVWTLLAGVREPLARLAWCLLFLLAPGVWFFSASVEVHSLQLLCVTIATLLAWRASTAPSVHAPFLLAGGLCIAMLGHLTSVLLIPALIVLALGAKPGRGLVLRSLPWGALLGVAVVLAFLLFGLFFRAFSEGRKGPFETLYFFWKFLRQRVLDSGLFSASEVLVYLRRELLAPAGLLIVCLPLALFQRGDRRLLLATVLALFPYLFVLPQGGIRENGAYYISLFPILVLASTRTLETRWPGHAATFALLVALVPQAVLGARAALAGGGGEDARVWARELRALCPVESVIYTATLPRWHAVSYVDPPFEAVDVWRVMEMMPASAWDTYADLSVEQARSRLGRGQRVFADVDLFRGGDRPEGVERLSAAFERAFPRRLPLPATDPLVLELLPE